MNAPEFAEEVDELDEEELSDVALIAGRSEVGDYLPKDENNITPEYAARKIVGGAIGLKHMLKGPSGHVIYDEVEVLLQNILDWADCDGFAEKKTLCYTVPASLPKVNSGYNWTLATNQVYGDDTSTSSSSVRYYNNITNDIVRKIEIPWELLRDAAVELIGLLGFRVCSRGSVLQPGLYPLHEAFAAQLSVDRISSFQRLLSGYRFRDPLVPCYNKGEVSNALPDQG